MSGNRIAPTMAITPQQELKGLLARKKELSALIKADITDISADYQAGNVVPFSVLQGTDIGTRLSLGEGVESQRIHGKYVRYHVYMEEGSVIEIHAHDCGEGIQVQSGVIRDTVTGEETRYSMYIHDGKLHRIKAIEQSVLIVDFFPF